MTVWNQKKQKMTRFLNKFSVQTILFVGIIVLMISCDNRPKGVLSQNEMTNILVEMHKLEGTFSEKSDSIVTSNDKIPYYNSILSKFNITQAEFDSSIVWYSKNPKKYEKIYSNVITRLTELNDDVKNRKFHPIDSVALKNKRIELWDSISKFTYTKDSSRTKLSFKIIDSTLQYRDKYILTFRQRIAPEDSCDGQHIVFRINYENGLTDSIYLKTQNDSLLKHYYIKFPALRKKIIKSISGDLFGSKKFKGKFNASIDSISLIREYNSLIQDSIYKMVRQASTIKSKKTTKVDSVK